MINERFVSDLGATFLSWLQSSNKAHIELDRAVNLIDLDVEDGQSTLRLNEPPLYLEGQKLEADALMRAALAKKEAYSLSAYLNEKYDLFEASKLTNILPLKDDDIIEYREDYHRIGELYLEFRSILSEYQVSSKKYRDLIAEGRAYDDELHALHQKNSNQYLDCRKAYQALLKESYNFFGVEQDISEIEKWLS